MLAKVMSFFKNMQQNISSEALKKNSCLLLVTDQEGNKCLIFKTTSNRKHIEKGPANYFVSLILSEMGVFLVSVKVWTKFYSSWNAIAKSGFFCRSAFASC